MSVLSRYGNALKGLRLFFTNVRIFPMDTFKGKRIVIVGPASTAFGTGRGNAIDAYDLVVRVNKSALVVDKKIHDNDIGTRTDILFHSFFENNESGGGPLDFHLFARQGIRYVINPRNNIKGLRNSFNFYKKYLAAQPTYTLPKTLYQFICSDLKGFKPTVGFTALLTLLESDFSELHITGFTFYRTPFGPGYRDQMQSVEKAKAFINQHGIHDVDLEFEIFRKALKRNQHKNIILEETLRTIANESTEK